MHFGIDTLMKERQAGSCCKCTQKAVSVFVTVCFFGTCVFKIPILHMQHQGLVAIGVDKRGRRLLHRYEPLILGHLKNWLEVVHRQNSNLDCRNRVLPGVVVLVSLAQEPRTKKWQVPLSLSTRTATFFRKSYHDL